MIMKIKEEDKDLNYWKENCKDDYLHTPISVLRYITELESKVSNVVLDDVIKCDCELERHERAKMELGYNKCMDCKKEIQ